MMGDSLSPSPSQSMDFADPNHGDFLTSRLKENLRTGEFSDVKFVVEGEIFAAHRNVMAASSDCFHAMLKGTFKEQTLANIKLEYVTAKAFQQIIEYSYTGKISITEECAQELYVAADMFLYKYIKTHCAHFILNNINHTTCLRYLLMAERHQLEEVKSKSVRHVWQHFEMLSVSPEMRTLPLSVYKDVVSSDFLRGSELTVLDSLCDWIKHNNPTDKEKQDLLDEFRFGLLKWEDLDCVQHKQDILGKELCFIMQTKLLNFHMDLREQPLKSGKFNKLRGGDMYMIVLGGATDHMLSERAVDTMDIFRIDENGHPDTDHRQTCPLPGPRTDFASVTIGNFLFMIGGQSPGGRIENTLHRYDPMKRYWIQLDHMIMKRCKHAAAVFDGYILVVGGCGEGGTPTAGVERYNVVQDTWERMGDFPQEMCSMAACTVGSRVVVCGGHSGSGAMLTNTLYSYDSEKDVWSVLKADLPHPYYSTGLCSEEGCLLILGGRRLEPKNEISLQSTVVDVGDASRSMRIPDMPWCLSRMGCVAVPGKSVILVGGYGGTYLGIDKGYKFLPTDLIGVYDIVTGKWVQSGARLSKPVCDCSAQMILSRSID